MRGAAAEALEQVAWNVQAATGRIWDFVDRRIVEEPLISVRCCLVRTLLPLFNSDRARCANSLEQLVETGPPTASSESIDDAPLAPLATHAAI